jgi:hypothetical protein
MRVKGLECATFGAYQWWQQLKQNRLQHDKLKINSWEKLLKKMRVTFLPHKYTMGQ